MQLGEGRMDGGNREGGRGMRMDSWIEEESKERKGGKKDVEKAGIEEKQVYGI